MFTIRVEHSIAAAHAIIIAGVREPLHGHNWHFQVTIERPNLDAEGLVCDFHVVHHHLVDVLAPFHNNNFNNVPPFRDSDADALNPTAELIAKFVCDELTHRLANVLPKACKVASVSVTEAPGCVATYFPGR
ncbi:MAG: 6-carboxytetrahydropterin synthase [Phycisphaerales bacterium]